MKKLTAILKITALTVTILLLGGGVRWRSRRICRWWRSHVMFQSGESIQNWKRSVLLQWRHKNHNNKFSWKTRKTHIRWRSLQSGWNPRRRNRKKFFTHTTKRKQLLYGFERKFHKLWMVCWKHCGRKQHWRGNFQSMERRQFAKIPARTPNKHAQCKREKNRHRIYLQCKQYIQVLLGNDFDKLKNPFPKPQ